jgi:hypothetical protein
MGMSSDHEALASPVSWSPAKSLFGEQEQERVLGHPGDRLTYRFGSCRYPPNPLLCYATEVAILANVITIFSIA